LNKKNFGKIDFQQKKFSEDQENDGCVLPFVIAE
jgi:hypothetical protein